MKRRRSLVLLALGLVASAGTASAQIEIIPYEKLSAGAKFLVAIEEDDIDKIRALLDSGLSPDTRKEPGDWTPLMKAAWEGTADIARLLLKAGADVNATDDSGSTALHRAAMRERPEISRILLEAGAKPDVIDQVLSTPLGTAVAQGNLELVEVLLKAGARTEVSGQSLSPLHVTAQRGTAEMIRLLVKYGADINYTYGEAHQTPLSDAIMMGRPEIVRVLVELKADVNQKGLQGMTPLEQARDGDQEDIVQILLAAGAKE